MNSSYKFFNCTVVLAGLLLFFANTSHAASVSSIKSQLAVEQGRLKKQNSSYTQFMKERLEKAPMAAYSAADSGSSCAVDCNDRLQALMQCMAGGGSPDTSAQEKHIEAKKEYQICSHIPISKTNEINRDKKQLQKLNAERERYVTQLSDMKSGNNNMSAKEKQNNIKDINYHKTSVEARISRLKSQIKRSSDNAGQNCNHLKKNLEKLETAAQAEREANLSAQDKYMNAKKEYQACTHVPLSTINKRNREQKELKKLEAEKGRYVAQLKDINAGTNNMSAREKQNNIKDINYHKTSVEARISRLSSTIKRSNSRPNCSHLDEKLAKLEAAAKAEREGLSGQGKYNINIGRDKFSSTTSCNGRVQALVECMVSYSGSASSSTQGRQEQTQKKTNTRADQLIRQLQAKKSSLQSKKSACKSGGQKDGCNQSWKFTQESNKIDRQIKKLKAQK